MSGHLHRREARYGACTKIVYNLVTELTRIDSNKCQNKVLKASVKKKNREVGGRIAEDFIEQVTF